MKWKMLILRRIKGKDRYTWLDCEARTKSEARAAFKRQLLIPPKGRLPVGVDVAT